MQQAAADYHTSLSYGETGSAEMHDYLQARLEPGREIIAGKDIVYHVVDRGYMADWRWSERDFLLQRLADPRTQFLVMGINHNTLTQLRAPRDDAALKAMLEDSYSDRVIGSYRIWERVPIAPPVAPGRDSGLWRPNGSR